MKNNITALVVGATGTLGVNIVSYLAEHTDWEILALSRSASKSLEVRAGVHAVAVDVTNPAALKSALRHWRITHVFYAAALTNKTEDFKQFDLPNIRRAIKVGKFFMPLIESIPPIRRAFHLNFAKTAEAYDEDGINEHMLKTVVSVCEEKPHQLESFVLVTGGKYYGAHLGPHFHKNWKQPFEENDPAADCINFYLPLEQYLKDRSPTNWKYTIVRPSFVVGKSKRAVRNILTAIAVYASILKELGSDLIFPGDDKSADAVIDMSDAQLISAFMHWLSIQKQIKNEAFNITNDQPISWRDLWAGIAAHFEMTAAYPEQGVRLDKMFSEHPNIWEEMVKKYDLQPYKLEEICSFAFLAKSVAADWDMVYSMQKAKDLGFQHPTDNVEMFVRYIEALRKERIIP